MTKKDLILQYVNSAPYELPEYQVKKLPSYALKDYAKKLFEIARRDAFIDPSSLKHMKNFAKDFLEDFSADKKIVHALIARGDSGVGVLLNTLSPNKIKEIFGNIDKWYDSDKLSPLAKSLIEKSTGNGQP
jgi:hypothetical protein